MSGGMRDALKDAVRKMAFRTSLDQLKKKGVKQVNVLGLDRIIGLIDQAVHKSLRSRLLGLEREQVADATKAEFLRLLKSNEDLQRSRSELERLKENAEDEVDQLRREIEAQRQALKHKLDEVAAAQRAKKLGEDEQIANQVQEVFQTLAGQPDVDLASVQDKVLELVMSVVQGERATTAKAKGALHDREVDLLQRRIAKLTESLGHTERRLLEVSAMKDIDEGISSVYREVQGLSAAEQNYSRKKELMTDLFKANLQLQKGADA